MAFKFNIEFFESAIIRQQITSAAISMSAALYALFALFSGDGEVELISEAGFAAVITCLMAAATGAISIYTIYTRYTKPAPPMTEQAQVKLEQLTEKAKKKDALQ